MNFRKVSPTKKRFRSSTAVYLLPLRQLPFLVFHFDLTVIGYMISGKHFIIDQNFF